MHTYPIHDDVTVGDIYYHSVEGVCVLSDITDYHFWFDAVDIDAKYPSNQKEPRAFKTEYRKKLERPHISVFIKDSPFLLGSIVFFIESGRVEWGYCVKNSDKQITLCVSGEEKTIPEILCFQVLI